MTRRLRGWLATWLQARRRARQAAIPPAVPNAPVITGGGFEWDMSEPGWADVWINWTFDHGRFPVAALEVLLCVDGGDRGEQRDRLHHSGVLYQ
jgi:hypothetical protein